MDSSGNAGTNPPTNFIGTIDAKDLSVKTNSVEALRIIGRTTNTGFIGINESIPSQRLTVKGNIMLEPNGANASELRFSIPSDTTKFTAFKAQPQTANITYTLPSVQGAPSTLLTNDGTGKLSWLTYGGAIIVPFSNISTGINTSATMTVGTGATLLPSGSGVVVSNQFIGTGSTSNAVDLATGEVLGTLPISNGGTNSNEALNNNRIMVSNTGSIVEAPALTNGQLLIGSTGAAPQPANITAGTGVSITNSPGGVLIGLAGGYAWNTLGNSGTSVATNFIGTIDAVDLSIKTNSTEAIRIIGGASNTGFIGINESVPSQRLTVNGNVLLESSGGIAPELRLAVPDNTKFTSFIAQAQGANITYTLPSTQGTANSILINNGLGTLSWGTSLGSGTIPFSNITSSSNTIADMVVGSGASITPSGTGVVAANQFIGTGSTSNAVDLATGEISGILPIANGGTNSGTALINNRIMISNGGAIIEAPALTNGQLFIGSTGAAPMAGNLIAGPGISITNAAGSITISSGGSFWNTLGNAGTNPVNNYIGTFDATDLSIRTNNTTEAIRIIGTLPANRGFVGINEPNPSQRLTVKGNVFIESDGSTIPDLRLSASNDNSRYTAFKTQAQGSNITYILPPSQGNNGSLLQNDGLGNLSWTTTLGNNITIPFDQITSGTNTRTAMMVVGSSSTLTPSGGGIVAANQFIGPGSTSIVVDLATTEVSGILSIARGGTNSGTALNNGRIMLSSGGAIVEAPALADGQLLIGASAGAPQPANLTAGTGVLITNSSGGISIGLSGGYAWNLTGNSGTTAGTNYLGTSDTIDLSVKTNSTERLRIVGGVTNRGNVGINESVPTQKLTVKGNVLLSPNSSTASQLRFAVPNDTSKYTAIVAQTQKPNAEQLVYTLPDSQSVANGFLRNDGSGLLSWATPQEVGGSRINVTLGTTNGDYNISSTDYLVVVRTANSNVYLPTASSLPGKVYYIVGDYNIDGFYVRVNTSSSDRIVSFNINATNVQCVAGNGNGNFTGVMIVSDGVSKWYIISTRRT